MLQCFKMQCCNYAIKIGQLGQFPLNDVIKRKCEKIVTIIICEIIITMSSRLMIANFLIFNRLKIDSTISHGNNLSSTFNICSFLSLSLSLQDWKHSLLFRTRWVFENRGKKNLLYLQLYPFQLFSRGNSWQIKFRDR